MTYSSNIIQYGIHIRNERSKVCSKCTSKIHSTLTIHDVFENSIIFQNFGEFTEPVALS